MTGDGLPGSFRLPASRKLKPIQQGEFDGLCGVYSVINAIRLVRADYKPVSRGELHALFSFAVYRLAESGDLRERLTRGVPWGILKQLSKRMVAVASPPGMELEFAVIHRFKAERLATMRRALWDGAPLIASVHQDEHYSVIVGWSPTRALLFDSSAGHWVPISTLEQALCVRLVGRGTEVTSDGQ